MSTSDLYRVSKTSTFHCAEFGNGWGSGPLIWGYLSEKYLNHSWSSSPFDDKRDLWDLHKDDRVPRCIQLGHLFTFDGAICPSNKTIELADALKETYEITHTAAPKYVNHFKAIANALRIVPHDKRALGFGLSCTSVSDPWIDWDSDRKHHREVWDIFTMEILYSPNDKEVNNG